MSYNQAPYVGGYPPYPQPTMAGSQPSYNQPGYPPDQNGGGAPYPGGAGPTGMPQPFQYNQPAAAAAVGFAPQPGYHQMPSNNSSSSMPYPNVGGGAGYPPPASQQPTPPYASGASNNFYPPGASHAPPYGQPASSYQPYSANASGGQQQQQQYYGGAAPTAVGYPPAHAASNYQQHPQQQQQQQHYQPASAQHAPSRPQQHYQNNSTAAAQSGTIYPNLSASTQQHRPTSANTATTAAPQLEPTVRPTPGFNAQIDAEVLYKAMKGFGTDEKALIRVLCRRTGDERMSIVKAYKQMYGKDLIANLKSELSSQFEKLMVSLCLAPDVYDAMSVRKAVEGFGTDEDSLVEILCTRTNREIMAMQAAYKLLYGRTMEHDIKGDTSGYFARLLISLLTASRDESTSVDVNRARQTAQELYSRGEKRWGTDEAYFNSVLAAQSYAQLRAVFDEYLRVTGHSMEQAIASEMSGDVKNGMLAIIKCVRSPAIYFAEALYKSMKGAGTTDHVLIRVLITRSERDLGSIKRQFQQMYHQSLEQFIKGDTSGDYERGLLALCGVVP